MKIIEQIEAEYQNQLNGYNPKPVKKHGADICAIIMARRFLTEGKIWWYAWELIGKQDEFWGSHRMPARLTDIITNYPELFEARSIGRYKVYRLKMEKLTVTELGKMSDTSFVLNKK